ncbi:MAG: YfaZ family outer membrane protein [Halorhodospira sp.]
MIKRIAIMVAFTLWAAAPLARELDVNLHDKAAEIGYYVQPDEATSLEDADMGGSLYFNEEGDVAASGLIHVLGPPAEGFSPLQLGAGSKGYLLYLDEPGRMVGAVALSGSARFSIPAQVPQALALRGHIAPSITAFGRADRLFEATVRYVFDLTPQASAYLGYRYLRVKMSKESNQTPDDDLHLGVRIQF